jgi:hypothetical protein
LATLSSFREKGSDIQSKVRIILALEQTNGRKPKLQQRLETEEVKSSLE